MTVALGDLRGLFQP